MRYVSRQSSALLIFAQGFKEVFLQLSEEGLNFSNRMSLPREKQEIKNGYNKQNLLIFITREHPTLKLGDFIAFLPRNNKQGMTFVSKR